MDQRINIVPGSPSVLFRRQLCHILEEVSWIEYDRVRTKLTVELSGAVSKAR